MSGWGGVSAGTAGAGETGPGPSHFGEAVQAERLVVAGLKRIRWSEAALKTRRKGESKKGELAGQLRSRMTMPLAWIAERRNVGTRGHLAWLLQRRGRKRPTAS